LAKLRKPAWNLFHDSAVAQLKKPGSPGFFIAPALRDPVPAGRRGAGRIRLRSAATRRPFGCYNKQTGKRMRRQMHRPMRRGPASAGPATTRASECAPATKLANHYEL